MRPMWKPLTPPQMQQEFVRWSTLSASHGRLAVFLMYVLDVAPNNLVVLLKGSWESEGKKMEIPNGICKYFEFRTYLKEKNLCD